MGISDLAESSTSIDNSFALWAFFLVILLAFFLIYKKYKKNNSFGSSIFKLLENIHDIHLYKLANLSIVGIILIVLVFVLSFFYFPTITTTKNSSDNKEEESVEVKISKNGINLTTGKRSYSIEGIYFSKQVLIEKKTEIAKGLKEFKEDRNYDKTIQIFSGLKDKVVDNTSRKGVISILNASYYGSNRNLDGLDFLCQIVKQDQAVDQGLIFDVHAHIRAISLSNGYEIAKSTALEYQKVCPKMPVSPVFAGIPLGKMEELKKGNDFYDGYFGSKKVSASDNMYLQSVLGSYPNDAQIAYAYYFMEEFEKVIQLTPNHLLAKLSENAMFSESRDYHLLVDRVNALVKKMSSVLTINQFVTRLVERMGDELDIISYDNFLKLHHYKNPVKLNDIFASRVVSVISKNISNDDFLENDKEIYLKVLKFLKSMDFGDFNGSLKNKILEQLMYIGGLNADFEVINKTISIKLKKNFASGFEKYLRTNDSDQIFDDSLIYFSFQYMSLEPVLTFMIDEIGSKGEIVKFKKIARLVEKRSNDLYEKFIDRYSVYLTNKYYSDLYNSKSNIKNISVLANIYQNFRKEFPGKTIHKIAESLSESFAESGELKLFMEFSMDISEEERSSIFINNFEGFMNYYDVPQIVSIIKRKSKFRMKPIKNKEIISRFSKIVTLSDYIKVQRGTRAIQKIPESIWNNTYYGDINRLLVNNNISDAKTLAKEQKKLLVNSNGKVPNKLTELIKELNYIESLTKNSLSQKDLLNSYLFIRSRKWDALSYKNILNYSLTILDGCIEKKSNTIENQKCTYLKSTTYKRLGKYSDQLEILEKFIRQYPDSHLADDALADIGVYYLTIRHNPDIANDYFMRVYHEYPDDNAADNALDWMRKYYEGQNEYKKALVYASIIAKKYYGNRISFGLESSLRTFYQRVYGIIRHEALSGVVDINDSKGFVNVKVSTNKNENMILSGDKILSIGGIDIRDTDTYKFVLSNIYKRKDVVTIVIDRLGEIRVVEGKIIIAHHTNELVAIDSYD